MAEKTPRRARRDLSFDEIVTVAFDLLETEPDSALTMRRLAEACRVTPMALYNHVEDREAILTAVVDRAFAEVADFDHTTYDDPSAALADFGVLMRRQLLANHGAASTFLRRPVVTPTMTRVTERLFEMVDRLVLVDAEPGEVADAIVLVTMGSVANDLTRPPEVRRKLLETDAANEAPLSADNLESYADRDGEVRFCQAIAWILAGTLAP